MKCTRFKDLKEGQTWLDMQSGNPQWVQKHVQVWKWVSRKFLHQCPHDLSNRQDTIVCRHDNSCQSWSQGFWRFQIPVHHQQWLVGMGVECDWELDLELLVPTLRHGKLGVQCRDCLVVGEWLNGCQGVQGFHTVQGIYQIVSWRVMSYGRIENMASNLEFWSW